MLIIRYLTHLETNLIDDPSLAMRHIDSKWRLLFNGYLGQFFRYRYFGFINWFILPILVIAALNFKKLTRAEIAVLLVYLGGAVIIVAKGYSNFRYQATFFPFTVLVILYSFYKFFKLHNQAQKFATYMILMVAAHFVAGATQNIFYMGGPNNLQRYHGVTDYINQMPDSGLFLVNNLPDFYYYTNKSGITFNAYRDYIFTPEGKHEGLMLNRNNQELANYLIDSLSCYYVFTNDYKNEFSPRFTNFIQEQCSLLVRDELYDVYLIQKQPKVIQQLP